MVGPEWMVIYGAGVILVAITAARFVMYELTGAVRQFKRLKAAITSESAQLPPKDDGVE